MSLILALGVGVAGTAMLGRVAMQASQNLKARGGLNWSKMFQRRAPSFKKFYEGGFEPEMTRGEAALILSIRQSASKEKIKMAHRRIMLANHPDNGGSDFLASKVNEAKEILLREAL